MSEKSKKKIVKKTVRRVLKNTTGTKVLKELEVLGSLSYVDDFEKYQKKIRDTSCYNQHFTRSDYEKIAYEITIRLLYHLNHFDDLSYVQVIKIIEALIYISDCVFTNDKFFETLRAISIRSNKVEFCLELCTTSMSDDIKWLLYSVKMIEKKK